jgi:hypothetical protein
MKRRCYNPTKPAYKYYGARGITICEVWLQHPEKFITWALEAGWVKGLTIDRENNDGPYSPENCRVATYAQQMRNTRGNRLVTYDGRTMILEDFIKIYAVVSRGTVKKRLSRGIDPIPAALTPSRNKKQGVKNDH